MSDNEIRIHPREPIAEGKTCLFEIRERFDCKAAYRKVYSDEQGKLYIMYKSRRYYEGEFKY